MVVACVALLPVGTLLHSFDRIGVPSVSVVRMGLDVFRSSGASGRGCEACRGVASTLAHGTGSRGNARASPAMQADLHVLVQLEACFAQHAAQSVAAPCMIHG